MANSGGGYLLLLRTRTEADRTLEGAAHARAILEAGYTTVRDCGNEDLLYDAAERQRRADAAERQRRASDSHSEGMGP